MPIRDIIAAALSRPAGRVVDGPVRDIVNEILADHGYASPAELAALKAEVDGLKGRLTTVDDKLAALGEVATSLQERVSALQTALASRPTTAPAAAQRSLIPQVPPAPDVPLVEREAWIDRAAESGSCKVMGCTATAGRDGFCPEHSTAWQAGTLAGFISPSGLVCVEGEPRLVDPALAGLAYAVDGVVVQVAGRKVSTVGY